MASPSLNGLREAFDTRAVTTDNSTCPSNNEESGTFPVWERTADVVVQGHHLRVVTGSSLTEGDGQ